MNHTNGSRLLGAWLLLSSFLAPAQVPPNELPLRIGADQNGGNVFRGEIAALRLYSRALTAAELASLAQAPRDEKGTVRGVAAEWLHPKLPAVSELKFDFPEG